MLAEFIGAIRDLSVKAAGASVVKVAEHDRTAYLVHDGKAEMVAVPPPLRNHSLFSVDSLCEFAQTAHGSVWHDESNVVVMLDDADRREWATLPLVKSAPFLVLENLSRSTKTFTQKELVRLLRHDLRNAGVENVLAAVKRLEWKRTNDGRSSVEHGRESLGRSVEAAVNNAESIPEFLVATIPVYSTPGADGRFAVYCTLEIDLQNERFALLPDLDSLADAVHGAQESLHEHLVEILGDTLVFYGRP